MKKFILYITTLCLIIIMSGCITISVIVFDLGVAYDEADMEKVSAIIELNGYKRDLLPEVDSAGEISSRFVLPIGTATCFYVKLRPQDGRLQVEFIEKMGLSERSKLLLQKVVQDLRGVSGDRGIRVDGRKI
ncbi:hypothetical protein [Undibacterium sp. Ren11W]|uniref:hypothetical protein n=1 Tax=Undibacterium sp. Ren11W TaxID=3413045 RepID=UPI003BF053BF